MITLAHLCSAINARYIHNGKESSPPETMVTGFAELDEAHKSDIAFFSNKKYLPKLKNTQAGIVILQEAFLSACPTDALIVADAYLAFAQATQLFSYRQAVQGQQIHAKSIVDESVNLPANIRVDAGAVIEQGCEIGDGTTIRSNAVIANNVKIGENCYIDVNVSVMHDCVIGNRCVIGPGSVVGSEGFGNAWDKENNRWCSIHHQGKVIMQDDVEIGANNAIDRGTVSDTIIEQGVRMDNLIMMAHNCHIGADTALAGQVGMAGHTVIGKRVKAAGQVGFAGHMEVADDSTLMGKSMVTGTIKESGVYAGQPHQKIDLWRKQVVLLRRQLNGLKLNKNDN